MRHKIDHRKLGRTSEHRQAMLRNMVASLFEHGRIQTTVPKAKEARRYAERCITIAKKSVLAAQAVAGQTESLKAEGDRLRSELAACSDDKRKLDLQRDIARNGGKIASINAKADHFRRLALSKLHHKNVVKNLIENVAPKYLERNGGYTRILKAGFRLGDKSPIAIFELV